MERRLEEQILLRVPPEVALRLNSLIEEGKASSTSSSTSSSFALTLKLDPKDPNDRRGQLHIDKQSFDGTLVDLPCIIETHKTFDNIAYYKSADIAQMLILHPLPTTSTTAGAASGADKAKEVGPPPVRYPSGLLPPTRDIRPKRFERDAVIPRKIVADVEMMLMHIRDETPIHTFKLIEEEVEIEVDEDEEWEEEDDQPITNPTPLATSSSPLQSSPLLPTIRIDPSSNSPYPPATSSIRPSSHLLTPSFSPQLLTTSSPSFSPSFGEGEEGRMREVADMDVSVSPSPSPREGKEEREEEEKMEEKVEEAPVDRATVLRAEIAELDRRIEETSAQINKQLNRLLKKKLAAEKLTPLEEERDKKRAELAALS